MAKVKKSSKKKPQANNTAEKVNEITEDKANKSSKKTEKTVEKTHHEKSKNSENKHPSEKIEEDKSSPWKLISIIFGVLCVLLLIVLLVIFLMDNNSEDENNSDNGNNNGNNSNNNNIVENNDDQIPVNLMVIEDINCEACQVDFFIENVKEGLFPQMETEKIDSTSEKGKKVIEELNVLMLPVYLFNEEIDKRSDWDQMQDAFDKVTYEGKSLYYLSPMVLPTKVLVNMPEILENSIVIGNENAKVTVYEFSDYECPFCAIAEGNEELVAMFSAQSPGYQAPIPEVLKLVEEGTVRYVFYNMPIASLHPKAKTTHMAALCANEQGMWEEYHKKLFADRSDWIEETDRISKFVEYAKEFGMDEVQFKECVETNKYEAQINAELALASKLGVSGTPAFFINKNFISGAQDFTTFKAFIDSELSN